MTETTAYAIVSLIGLGCRRRISTQALQRDTQDKDLMVKGRTLTPLNCSIQNLSTVTVDVEKEFAAHSNLSAPYRYTASDKKEATVSQLNISTRQVPKRLNLKTCSGSDSRAPD